MPPVERSLKVEAVVLRHSDWGEADRILVLYTREQGKIRCVAKGVRRLHSRKAGHLEPFTRSKLLLARGRDLWIVTQAETVEAYLPMREDLMRMGYASYVIELLDRFTYEEGENRALYQLLADTLARVAQDEAVIEALRYYEIRLLDLLGFRPELFQCVMCRSEIKPEDQYFSAEKGGVLCPTCGQRDPSARPVTMMTLKFLRHYQRSSYAEARRASLTPAIQREVEALIQYYFTYLLERTLNTPEFIREIRQ